MADKRISDLTALVGAAVSADDVLPIVDSSASETKKIRIDELAKVNQTLENKTLISPVVNNLNGGQLAGARNKIINGAMGIDQRNAGASQTITAAAALAYTLDRWYAYCTGANVTGQRVAGTSPNQFNYRFTGAASVTKIGFAQRIESANSQDLAGQNATLSVDLANSLLASVTWTVWYANTSDAFGTLASPTRTQIATGTFNVSSTLARYSAQIAIPSAANTGLEVEFSVGAQTSGTWTIGRAQVEIGSTATPFEHRPIGQELALCQRYYYRIRPGVGQPLAFGANYSTAQGRFGGAFPVTMRVAPTVLEQSGTANQYAIAQAGIGSTTCSAVPVISLVSAETYSVTGIVASGLTAFNPGHLSTDATNGANAFLGFSAEL